MSEVRIAAGLARRSPVPRAVHPIAGSVALVTIASFLSSTIAVEIAGATEAIVRVKTLIPWGLLVLVPALALTGGSGFALAGRHGGGRVAAKARRMKLIAANGILVLVPAAFFLAMKAAAGELDAAFYAVQAIEILAGIVNLTLIVRNLRDGLALRAMRNRKQRT